MTWALWGRINNAGQCCVASKRFIAVEAVADRFLTQFTAAMQGLQTGDPMDAATTLAPLSSAQALTTLVDQVDRSVAGGARVVMGGKRVEGVGRLHAAHDPHRHRTGKSRVQRGVLWSGDAVLSRAR